jgi:Uma2 family endonuclease
MAFAPDISNDRHWTVADYMEIDDDRRYELLEGTLVMVPSPDIYHQRAITQLAAFFVEHVREHGLGECFDAPFDVVLSDDTVVQPDFTFVRGDRLADLYDGHCITGAPDMVVEVLSEGTATRDRRDKRRLYADAGVPWLLLVEPKGRVVEVFQLGDDGKYILETTAADDDRLEFDLFPDLAVDLSDIWFTPPNESEEISSE